MVSSLAFSLGTEKRKKALIRLRCYRHTHTHAQHPVYTKAMTLLCRQQHKGRDSPKKQTKWNNEDLMLGLQWVAFSRFAQ